ncbi:molybdenum cofactor guanylyltransferase [bacterium]|nr:molybdenum cofactor guanylyltransferase [bacterium]
MEKIEQGFILSGGKSSRFGQDKGTFKINEKTFVEHSINLLRNFTQKITVLTNQPEKYEFLKLPLLEDKIKNCGPIGGLFAALSETKSEWNFFLPCDVPFLEKEILKTLLKNLDTSKQVILPQNDGKIEPLIAIYNQNVLPKIQSQIQKKDFAIKNLLLSLETKIIKFEGKNFSNINTQEDLWKV